MELVFADGHQWLDELKNDITRKTPASFEPTIDYVIAKMPRLAFEKFPQADPTLTTRVKCVGKTMVLGRRFKESLQQCLRSPPARGCGKAQMQHAPKHTP